MRPWTSAAPDDTFWTVPPDDLMRRLERTARGLSAAEASRPPAPLLGFGAAAPWLLASIGGLTLLYLAAVAVVMRSLGPASRGR